MSLSRQEIELAYQLFLGRKPSQAEAERMQANQSSVEGMRRVFLNSPEFRDGPKRTPAPEAKGQAQGQRTLIHLHIPKTAGSSLSRILARETPPEARLTLGDHNLDQLTAMSRPRRQQIRLLFGHLSHGVARQLPQRCQYISVLRQPGPRLLSFYRYIGRTEHHPLHRAVTGGKMSFGDFLDYTARTPEFRIEVDNGQSRRLAGNMTAAGLGREKALLRRALHHIFSPHFIYGLTEHFEDFQKRLAAQGLVSKVTPIRENVAPDPGNLEAELDRLTTGQREIYDSYTLWDSQLYSICHGVYFAAKPAKEPRS